MRIRIHNTGKNLHFNFLYGNKIYTVIFYMVTFPTVKKFIWSLSLRSKNRMKTSFIADSQGGCWGAGGLQCWSISLIGSNRWRGGETLSCRWKGGESLSFRWRGGEILSYFTTSCFYSSLRQYPA